MIRYRNANARSVGPHNFNPLLIYVAGEVRPNILLFDDEDYDSSYSDAQEEEYLAFMDRVKEDNGNLLIIELGLNPDYKVMPLLLEKLMLYERTSLIRVPWVYEGGDLWNLKRPDKREDG